MYCIKCGVKLAETEEKCPLCGTVLYHPDVRFAITDDLYPKNRHPATKVSLLGALIIVACIFFLPIVITLLCDISVYGAVTWSGYVIGAIVLAYEIFMFPLWFKKPNPVIFVPCGFLAVGLYLLYINFAVDGNWFLSFAFPVVGTVGLIVTAVVTLAKYVHRGKLYIFGGAFLALGAFCPVMEFLMNFTFEIDKVFAWSLYPMAVLVLIGGVLIFFAICRPARESIERKIFI